MFHGLQESTTDVIVNLIINMYKLIHKLLK